MEPELAPDHIKIKISEPLMKDTTFKKHIRYPISGYDASGFFENQRRYKEFNLLRNILVSQWPGCYVPMIPPKKIIVKSS
jgi:sorting nexin-1/2